MEIKTGDEFLALETGTVYVVHAVSKHGTQLILKTKSAHTENEFVIHMNPERMEMVQKLLKEKMWVPNTPAARTLYGYETR